MADNKERHQSHQQHASTIAVRTPKLVVKGNFDGSAYVAKDIDPGQGTVIGSDVSNEIQVGGNYKAPIYHGVMPLQDQTDHSPSSGEQVGEKYVLDGSKPGRVLILSNEFNSKTLSTRRGTLLDVVAMEDVFESMGCEVEKRLDVKKGDWNKHVEDFKTDCIAKGSSFIVVVCMTHGDKGDKLYTEDGKKIHLYGDLVYKFNNKNFPEFQGKPKLFFIQACAGTETQEDSNSNNKPECDSTQDATKPSHQSKETVEACMEADGLGKLEDAFVGRSTLPLLFSYRNTKTGSHYIQALKTVFEKNWEQMDVASMHKEVRKLVESSVEQTPHPLDFGFKSFKFPGPPTSK